MPALLLYLLKANVALLLFFLAYHLVLRKLTFYHLNRFFLVFGIVFSAAYPFIDLTELFNRHAELAAMQSYAMVLPAWSPTAIPEQAAAFDYWGIPVTLFWAGCAFMSIRLLLQFVSLYRIHANSIPADYKGIRFREVQGIAEAFSFWKTIYLNPAKHQSPELESILEHEQIHVKGWHTLDVLLAELSTVFYWFNPGVWLMRKAMKENLEFIADQHVVDAGVDRKEYQYLLLKVVGATQPQIANQFNFPSLKRRIAMMNKNQTSLTQIVRYAVLIPLIAAPTLILSANSKTSDPITLPAQQAQGKPITSQPDSIIYYIDGKEDTEKAYTKLDPKEISSVAVYKDDYAKKLIGNRAAKGIVSIITEKNKTSRQVQEFNKNFPPLPPPPAPEEPGTPPPPPPAPAGEQLPPPPPPVRYDGPAIPKAGGARVVENEDYVLYVLWPEESTKREFEVAQNTFQKNGFDLKFENKYKGNKLSSVKITLASKQKHSSANAVYTTTSLQSLIAADNIVLIKGNKKTGEVMIGTTLAPR